jgi:hypothetical protein
MNDLENGDVGRQSSESKLLPLGVKGLAGWLVLVQIGLYLTMITLLVQIFRVNLPAFEPDTWGVLTSKDSELYHALWGPIIVFEGAYNIAFLLFCIFVLVMFYTRKSILPKLMIIFYSASLAVGIIDTILVYQIPLAREMETGSSFTDIVRSAITCAIWIPYFLKSERVQNTFIK